MAPFYFFLSADRSPITPDSPVWQAPLPTSRAAAKGPPPICTSSHETGVTVGAYFSAVRQALGNANCAPLYKALTARLEVYAEGVCIDSVDIRLLKHGQFYHPSQVVVRTEQGPHCLALNVAVSLDGIELMPREIAALSNLAEQEGDLGIPPVLAQGECTLEDLSVTPAGERNGLWFLTSWFEGFHEFHLTRRADRSLTVMVWDGASIATLLSENQTAALLEAAAQLLTKTVNPHTLAHIFPWHHAAGDFVVHLDPSEAPHLRLITVRDYQPLLPAVDSVDVDAALDRLLYAQLLLMIQVALRLRVDRVDGIGEIVLYPVSMVAPICRGLLQGLTRMRRRWDLPAELDTVLADYLCSPTLEELHELNRAIRGGFALGSPEWEALKPHLIAHTQAFYDSLQKCLRN